MTEEYFKRPYGLISYDSEKKLGSGIWDGFLSSHEYREAAEKCIRLINEKDLHGWLADNRKMKAIRQQDQEWTLNVLMPQFLESPLKKMATIVSEDIFNKMAVESMFNRGALLITFQHRYFRNEEDALNWLESGAPNLNPLSESEFTEVSE